MTTMKPRFTPEPKFTSEELNSAWVRFRDGDTPSTPDEATALRDHLMPERAARSSADDILGDLYDFKQRASKPSPPPPAPVPPAATYAPSVPPPAAVPVSTAPADRMTEEYELVKDNPAALSEFLTATNQAYRRATIRDAFAPKAATPVPASSEDAPVVKCTGADQVAAEYEKVKDNPTALSRFLAANEVFVHRLCVTGEPA